MTVHVQVTVVFSVRTAVPETLFEHADAVMEELLQLENQDNIIDSAVSVDRGIREVTIEVVGCGSDGIDATMHAMSAIRSAIHAAGGATPDWQTGWDMIQQTSSVPQLADA